MKPVIKYPGGKRALLPYIRKYLNFDSLAGGRYWEAFAGGLAVTLDLEYPRTVVNDLNAELINMYTVIRDFPEELKNELALHGARHSADYFYEVRSWDRDPNFLNRSSVARAARTIYLNKTCFNGLYRVNSKGYFNSPLGKTSSGKLPDIIQNEAISEMSEFLKTVDIRCGDYSKIFEEANSGDFIYADPPYAPGSEISTDGFVGYQADGWSLKDLINLERLAKDAWDRGCKVLLSNNDTPVVREIFKDWDFEAIGAPRAINCKAGGRKGQELLIFSKNII